MKCKTLWAVVGKSTGEVLCNKESAPAVFFMRYRAQQWMNMLESRKYVRICKYRAKRK